MSFRPLASVSFSNIARSADDKGPLLSISGKLVIIFTMLVGRIGILAFFISFYKEYKKKNYTYPQENILM